MKIKICGIKSEAEARAVLACEYRGRRVDFLGVIFAKSVRLVSQETARKIAQIAHENGAKIVGVFVEQNDSEICEIAKFCDLDIVQIYRQTDATFMQNLATIRARNLYANLISNLSEDFKLNLTSNRPQIWQVVRIKDEIPKISGVFDMILFDYKGANLGGNGRSFDFGLLKNLDFKFGIAGGIGAHNINEAMKFCPEILDINSKVEDEFGIKNPNLINEILKKVEQ
jgi:phosphoribosylanthranilate isomerase